MDTEIRVREAMTPQVATINSSKSVHEAAKVMAAKNIGSIVIVDNGNPLGIITERDICFRVGATDSKPSAIKVKDIMSKNLISISPDKLLVDASRVMAKNNIRRLLVIDGKKLAGIITTTDIISLQPEQIEILREINNMSQEDFAGTSDTLERGACENCRAYGVTLTEIDGLFVCESCKEEILGE